MTTIYSNSAVLLATLVLALGGCSDPKPAAAAAPVTVETFSCKIDVAAKVEPQTFEGRAEGPDEAKVEEDAWADVCGKLPEALRDTCRDDTKWSVSSAGGSASAGGPKTYSKTITLREKLADNSFSGESESIKSMDEACTAATLAACKAAGADGDCVAAGTHESRGKRSSTTRKTVSDPK